MDQATQVNFSTVPRNTQKRIRRHNTLAELNNSTRSHYYFQENNKRPVSLNYTGETKKEKTPPFPSLNSTNNNYKAYNKVIKINVNLKFEIDCFPARINSMKLNVAAIP